MRRSRDPGDGTRRELSRDRYHTALVFEPDPALRSALRHLLLSQGFRTVLEAGRVNESILLMKEELVDLVLTRWEGRPVRGKNLLRVFKKQGQSRRIPVILLDGGLPRGAIVSAVKEGIAGRLTVPVNPGPLRDLLRTIREARVPDTIDHPG